MKFWLQLLYDNNAYQTAISLLLSFNSGPFTFNSRKNILPLPIYDTSNAYIFQRITPGLRSSFITSGVLWILH